MNKRRYNEEDFEGFLKDLIDSGRIEGMEAGITKFAMNNGYETLSNKPKYVFERMIKENSIEECKRCSCDIPWSEMLEALDNGGYCNYCQHMMEKND